MIQVDERIWLGPEIYENIIIMQIISFENNKFALRICYSLQTKIEEITLWSGLDEATILTKLSMLFGEIEKRRNF